MSSVEQPSVPVIVVKANERITAVPKSGGESSRILSCPILADAVFENSQNTFYNTGDVYDSQNNCIIGGGGGSGGGGNTSCDRDSNNGKDRLYRLKFVSMNAFAEVNEWFDGGQDIELTVVFARANGVLTTVKKFFSGSDSDFKDCPLIGSCDPQWFYTNDAEIVTWDEDLYGNAMLFSWIEKDDGDPITITDSFSTTIPLPDQSSITLANSVEFTITDEDDIMGSSIVEYCDFTAGNGYEYIPGLIRFNLRQL